MYLWHVCTDFAQFVDDHAPLSVVQKKQKQKISEEKERPKDESIRQILSIKKICVEATTTAQR